MADRIALLVLIDLDPLPGAMHTPASAKENVEAILLTRLPHYAPVVIINE